MVGVSGGCCPVDAERGELLALLGAQLVSPALVVREEDPGLDVVFLAVDEDGFGVLAGDLQVFLALDERGERGNAPLERRALPALRDPG